MHYATVLKDVSQAELAFDILSFSYCISILLRHRVLYEYTGTLPDVGVNVEHEGTRKLQPAISYWRGRVTVRV